MPVYRLLRGFLSLAGSEGGRRDYKAGDTISLTEEQAGRMKGRVEMVGENKSQEGMPSENPPNPVTDLVPSPLRDWSFVRDRKATEVIDIIKNLTSKDDLIAVRAEEGKSDSPRTGVLKAISARLGQLEE